MRKSTENESFWGDLGWAWMIYKLLPVYFVAVIGGAGYFFSLLYSEGLLAKVAVSIPNIASWFVWYYLGKKFAKWIIKPTLQDVAIGVRKKYFAGSSFGQYFLDGYDSGDPGFNGLLQNEIKTLKGGA